MFLTVYMYITIMAFVVFSLRKARQYARNPLAGRWELYPVPGESGPRRRYGGSYYEDAGWWTKPRQVSRVGQYSEMLKEMLFMKNLFLNRGKFWLLSYAMHLGIYLLGLFTLFLIAGAATEMLGFQLDTGSHFWAAFVYFTTAVTGFTGALLTALGGALLLAYRATDRVLRKYTTSGEYFNLTFILAVAASGLAVWGTDLGFNHIRQAVKAMLSLAPIQADGILMVHLLLFGALLMYIPWTKMSHYIGKYFAYHRVLWDNEPNLRGSALERIVEKNLADRSSAGWSSPHTKTNKD
ncbi:MAG: nitrate reductase gamma subunit [Peptococcaceae bacterium]|nr:nitrate reductase gamma subunit [Candidatus Syntrophopropionicum ammoniitolerans]